MKAPETGGVLFYSESEVILEKEVEMAMARQSQATLFKSESPSRFSNIHPLSNAGKVSSLPRVRDRRKREAFQLSNIELMPLVFLSDK